MSEEHDLAVRLAQAVKATKETELVDLGAIQCGAKPKTFIIELKRHQAYYRLVIEAKQVKREHSVVLYRSVGRSEYAAENIASYPDVIGYVLTRAISRGVDKCEYIETETTVLMNFGEMS